MKYLVVGLGNVGEEYVFTRHNTGFVVVDEVLGKNAVDDGWKESKVAKALVLEDKIGKHSVVYAKPTTMMNLSGGAVRVLADKYKVKSENVVVIHDDVDLPLGKFKIQMNRGSGGHKGVESVIKALRTKNFVRIRVGVSPLTPSGKIKKPKGEEKIYKHLLGKYKTDELKILKKLAKNISKAIEVIVVENPLQAMNDFN